MTSTALRAHFDDACWSLFLHEHPSACAERSTEPQHNGQVQIIYCSTILALIMSKHTKTSVSRRKQLPAEVYSIF